MRAEDGSIAPRSPLAAMAAVLVYDVAIIEIDSLILQPGAA